MWGYSRDSHETLQTCSLLRLEKCSLSCLGCYRITLSVLYFDFTWKLFLGSSDFSNFILSYYSCIQFTKKYTIVDQCIIEECGLTIKPFIVVLKHVPFSPHTRNFLTFISCSWLDILWCYLLYSQFLWFRWKWILGS